MLLNEIFNTKPVIKWSTIDDNKHRGIFILGTLTYIIKVDEWEMQLPGLLLDFLDIGFTAGETAEIQTLNSTKQNKATQVLGAVLNSVSPLIRKLNPTAILFGAQKSDPMFKSRMSVYETVADFYMKNMFPNKIKDIETVKGNFILISKVKITGDQLKTINDYITTYINPKIDQT